VEVVSWAEATSELAAMMATCEIFILKDSRWLLIRLID
jgi:hypothetical protein